MVHIVTVTTDMFLRRDMRFFTQARALWGIHGQAFFSVLKLDTVVLFYFTNVLKTSRGIALLI